METESINTFAQTNFRNENRKFGIKLDDRRRHFYVIGKTGMGKTVLLENMILSDIYAGHGIAFVDPHGDTAERMINYIPEHRIEDVVYFNPSDADNPVGFNILEIYNPDHKHLVVAGLMGVFKKIWVDQWSARMEYILNNTILALMDTPGTTLLGINRMYADKKFRKEVVAKVTDPVVRAFWVDEYANWDPRYEREATAAIQNKIGQFLSAAMIRNIVAQVKSTINVREIMDTGKILIVNLAKGRIGEDNSRLLGGMLVTKIQLSAMERVDIDEEDRKDFFLYVDEFQNFATESFADILSEARKYRLGLIMAHQYIEQLDEAVAAAVFGNVGTIACFRVGATDAEVLEKEFEPHFTVEDLINLPKWKIYLRLMIDGVASQPFSADTLPPIAEITNSAEEVIRVSREKYSRSRSIIEEKISTWSGVMDKKEEEKKPSSGRSDGRWQPKGRDTKKSSSGRGYEGRPENKKNPSARLEVKKEESRHDRPKEESKQKSQEQPKESTEPQKEAKEKERPKQDEKSVQHHGDSSSGVENRKKRRRRKKKGGSHGEQKHESDMKKAQDVVRGDPGQRGISLKDLG